MNQLNIFYRKKKARISKKWQYLILKHFPGISIKRQPSHPLRPVVTKGKAKITMVSFIGKIIEKISYIKVLAITVIILLGSTLIYMNQPWPGPKDTLINHNFLDCLYFSTVTFTSLGYGDMTPIGICRLVAGIEVFLGLFLVAILVGKVATERQNTWIQLIYTSINQDRLNSFKESIFELTAKFKTTSDSNIEEDISKEIDDILPFISGIKNYLIFQSNQGKLAYFGNKSSLRSLYSSLLYLQNLLTISYSKKQFGDNTNTKFEKAQVKIYIIAAYMRRFHRKQNSVNNVINNLLSGHNNFIKAYDKIHIKSNESKFSTRVMSASLINDVHKRLPAKPWPKGIHKQISKELHISNSLCTKCIDELIRKGSFNQ